MSSNGIDMTFPEIKIPSNRKFGFFFSFVFALAAAYFYGSAFDVFAYTFGAASSVFLVVTVLKADVLLPLNKLWMRFGFLLGLIVSPMVLGLIFFVIVSPVAIVLRFTGRDELRLKLNRRPSYWVSRSTPIKSESFKQQF